MGSTSNDFQLVRYGLFNFILSFLYLFICSVHMQSFYYGACFMFLAVSVTTTNVVKVHHKCWHLEIPKSRNDDIKNFKNFHVSVALKLLCIIILGVFGYYVVFVLFGAPLFESYHATLYLSCLMTLMTVYPFCCCQMLYDVDLLAIIRMLHEFNFKKENLIESHLLIMACWSVFGAWVGAFPIPLDWDRPWQVWPTSCCIGSILGYAGAHLFLGGKMLWTFYKERKRYPWEIFV